MPYSDVKINGSSLVLGRSTRLFPNRLSVSLQGNDTFEFSEGPGAKSKPSLALFGVVEVRIDTSSSNKRVFKGRIYSVAPQHNPNGWTYGYVALGWEHEVNRIPIIGDSGTSTRYVFNAPRDSEDYVAARHGKTVGQIARAVLEDHQSALSAIGVGLANVAEFEALEWTPIEPVEVSGESLLAWLKSFLSQWALNYRVYLDYSETTIQLRLANLSSPSRTVSVTVGEQLIEPPSLSISIDSCATRVEAIGDEDVEAFEWSLAAGKLQKNWTSTEQTNWRLSDWQAVGNAVDAGAVTTMTSGVVTINPDDNARSWASNYWAGARDGQIHLTDTSISGVESQALRAISSHTALSANGTCEVTVERPLPMNSYTRYKIFGLKLGLEHVWRKVRPTNQAEREGLRSRFPIATTYRYEAGSLGVTGVTYPLGFIVKNGVRYQMIIEVDRSTGDVLFTEPYVAHTALGNQNLDSGTVDTLPDDVIVWGPVSRGPLKTSFPQNSGTTQVFSGLGKDWYNIQQTRYLHLPSWRDKGAESQIRRLCEETHKAYKDPIISGSLTLHGFQSQQFFPLNCGVSLAAVAAPSGSTVDLGKATEPLLPVQSVQLDWGGNTGIRTTVNVSTERRPATNLDLFAHQIDGRGYTGFLQIQGLPEEGQEFGGVDTSAIDASIAQVDSMLYDPVRNYLPTAGEIESRIGDYNNFLGDWINNGPAIQATLPKPKPKPPKPQHHPKTLGPQAQQLEDAMGEMMGWDW